MTLFQLALVTVLTSGPLVFANPVSVGVSSSSYVKAVGDGLAENGETRSSAELGDCFQGDKCDGNYYRNETLYDCGYLGFSWRSYTTGICRPAGGMP